jgi:hypothetical protein
VLAVRMHGRLEVTTAEDAERADILLRSQSESIR